MPPWISRLAEDIRNVPRPSITTRQRSNRESSPGRPCTQRTSLSNASTRRDAQSNTTGKNESSATSAPDVLAVLETTPSRGLKGKKRRTKKRRLPPKGIAGKNSKTSQRGWNEFDDGSEGERAEPFTIFIDPNGSTGFPGTDFIMRAADTCSHKLRSAWKKASKAIQRSERSSRDEHSPLLGESQPTTADDSSESGEDKVASRRRNYRTIPKDYQLRPRAARESLLLHCCLGWLTASFVLLLVAAILLGTGRRKAVTEVDVGVIIGVTASVVFAMLGVGCMSARQDRLGWLHVTAVILTCVLELLANGLILFGLIRM